MKNKFLLIVAGTVALTAGALLANNTLNQAPEVKAAQYQPAKVITPIEFDMGKGKITSDQLFADKWTMVFVGYTFCPDICPTALADLNRIYPELSKVKGLPLQVVFVSVDPNRDKADKLADYAQYFNPEFKGVTAGHQFLFPFVRELGMVYSLVEEGTEGQYMVDHSASIALINPKGELRAIFRPEFKKGEIPKVDMDQLVKDSKAIRESWG